MRQYWISFDPRHLRTHTLVKESIPRKRARELISPYDVPEGLKIKVDEERGVVELEFVYSSEQEQLTSVIDNHALVVKVGKHSRRIHYVRLDGHTAGSLPIDDPMQRLVEAIDRLIETTRASTEDSRAYANYRLAKEAVSGNSPQFKALSRFANETTAANL